MDEERLPTRVQWARRGYILIVGLFTVCVAVQIYLAGMAVFVDPANWSLHMSFVQYFQYLPLVLFPLAFIGRTPRELKLLPVGLVLLLEVQYVTAELFGSLVGAIHPVTAFVILWTAIHTTQRAWSNI